MAKKSLAKLKLFKHNGLSQILIVGAILFILVGTYEAVTQNDFTNVAPTQLFIAAGVLGILGLYLKDEK